MPIDNEIIEKYDYLPYTAEDDICQHKGEPNHKHTKYNGKEYLPYAEWKENRELRIKKLILTEAQADTAERIDALLEEMEKEPPIEERKRDSYDIGYLVALKEARLRIRKIFKVD